MRKQIWFLVIICVLVAQVHPAGVSAQIQDKKIYLPSINNQYNPFAGQQIVNAPYFQVGDVVADKFPEMSIFWFGKVLPTTNYTDVRVGYNDQALYVFTNTVDRRLWYNPSSNGSNLENWDAVTLLLDLDGSSKASLPTASSYRIVTQLFWWEGSSNFRRVYRGNGQGWQINPIAFTSTAGWRGNAPNDDTSDKGWSMTYEIPFTSLGLTTRPVDGTVWRMALEVFDRDSQTGALSPTQRWPEGNSENQPSSWGYLRFGLPTYSPPSLTNVQTTTIRHKLNGAVVPDVSAGGGMVCGSGLDHWTEWGEANYAGEARFNIQNQKDISEYPCFSKYYVTFPLSSIPAGKGIRSAKLVLHEFGGSNPAEAKSSMIQVLVVKQDWNEATLNWNNAPQALENVSRSVVRVYTKDPIVWPGDPYEWDLSRAVAQAYQDGTPLRLALYSADKAMHSGKYFISSDEEDWNAVGRPTLFVQWGDW